MENLKLQIVSDNRDEMKTAFTEMGRHVTEQAEQLRPTIEKMNALGKEVSAQIAPWLETLKIFQSNLFEKQVEVANKLAPVLKQIKEAQEKRDRFISSAIQFEPIVCSPEVFIARPLVVSRRFIREVVIETIDELGVTPVKEYAIEGTISNPTLVQLPAGTRFEDLIITIKNEREIIIDCKGEHIGKFDCEQLGFTRKNTDKFSPDKQWELFSKLVFYNKSYETADENGNKKKHEMWATTNDLTSLLKIKEHTLFKTKSKLARKLSVALGIPGDPFLPYDQKLGYRTKFVLKSPLTERRELYPSGSHLFDNLDYKDEIDMNDQFLH